MVTAAVVTAADLHVLHVLTVIKHAVEVNHYPAINVLYTEGLEGPGAHLRHCIRTWEEGDCGEMRREGQGQIKTE